MTLSRTLRYVAPNFVTCVGLSLGLLAMFRAIEGDGVSAAWWIMACVLIDKLDGSLARLLDAQSEFGVQMDSLSDLITFCVTPAVCTVALVAHGAPALLVPAWALWGAAMLYASAGALRLARFNLTTEEDGGDAFQGVPTTMAGAFVAALFLVAARYGLTDWFFLYAPVILITLGLAMVSPLPIPKVKLRRSRFINGFIIVNGTLVYVAGLTRLFPEYLLGVLFVYLFAGGGYYLIARPHNKTT
jgi:CDP-diacylglycerol---serine O-phosphatidyltransferase